MEQLAQRLYNEDIEQFFADLMSDEDTIRVLRSQLHIEYHLEEIIRAASSSKKAAAALATARFSTKIDVACALGLSERLLKPLHVLRDIRNHFAHNLKVSLGVATARKLYDSFDKIEVDIMKQSIAKLPRFQIKATSTKPRNLAADELFSLCIVTLRSALIHARTQIEVAMRN